MKLKLLSFALLCAVALTTNAQTEKGKNLIGGSIGYGKNENTPSNTTNSAYSESNYFNVIPKFGHFVDKNLAIGLGVGYSESKNLYGTTYFISNGYLTTTSIAKNKAFNIGPFVRYYVDIADKFKFFGQGNFDFAIGKTNQSSSGTGTINYQSSKYKSTSYTASINPGFAFFPAKKWAIEFSFPLLSYNKSNFKDDGINQNSLAYENNSLTFGLNTFVPSIGINFHF